MLQKSKHQNDTVPSEKLNHVYLKEDSNMEANLIQQYWRDLWIQCIHE
jgi:hypothetical protein